jgi:hypothetical protein
LNPVPLSARQKYWLLGACVAMALSGIALLVVGIVKGIVAPEVLGALMLIVASAEVWLYRHAPTSPEST